MGVQVLSSAPKSERFVRFFCAQEDGECKLSREQIKEIAFTLAHDLLEFAGIDGDMSNLSAKSVFTLLNAKNKDLTSNN